MIESLDQNNETIQQEEMQNSKNAQINTQYNGSQLVFLEKQALEKQVFLFRELDQTFTKNQPPTLGITYSKKIIERKNLRIRLDLWDTAGQERFNNLAPLYFRNISSVLLVYDISNRKSFEQIEFWLNEVEKYISKEIIIFLIGNKIDKINNREVSEDEGKTMAKKYNLYFLEVSAKSNCNINKLFRRLTRTLVKQYYEKNEILKQSNIQYLQVQDNKNFSSKIFGCCSK